MKKHLSILSSAALLIALSMSITGCSSSQTSDSEFGDDVPADAGTDAVPAESAENTPAATDQQAPSPDQAQTPDQMQAQSTNPDPSASPDPSQQQQLQASNDQQPPAAAPQDPNAGTPSPTAPEQQAQTTPPAAADTSAAPVVAATTPSTPDNTPAATTSTPSSSTGGTESYSVHRGDTLMRIAFEKYGDLYKWKQIYEANRDKIKDPNVILPGTVLTLENVSNDLPARTGKKYMIKQGDTLARISSDVYGTPSKWKKIWEHNKPWIPNPNKIFAGFYLYYTGGKNPEDIEQHEEQNPVSPMAQDSSAPQAPRDPASTTTTPAN